MLKILYRIICLALIIAGMLIWTERAQAYHVSGVVEFSYRDFETKKGNSRSVEQYWSQTYRADLDDYVFDPRAIQYTAGIGYNVINSRNAPDTRSLDYNLHARFFPGMRVSADVFGQNNTVTVQNIRDIAGYDLEVTRYGGTVRLNLSSGGRSRNNNYNNYTNNNNYSNYNNYRQRGLFNRLAFILPDVTLSQNHTESKSLSPFMPRRETLDSTKALLHFRPRPVLSLDLDGGIERYRNDVDRSSYETKTAGLSSTIAVLRDADLKIDGRITDRMTENVPGYTATGRNWVYNMLLSFKGTDRLQHSYRYNYSNDETSAASLVSHGLAAAANYLLRDDLQVLGGLDYTVSRHVLKATPIQPEQKDELESGSAHAGVIYNKTYQPDFLGPFSLHTNYGFSYGFSNYTAAAGQPTGGSGMYYTNDGSLEINSKGWQRENLSFSYGYRNKRDYSPIHNVTEVQRVGMHFSTSRLPKTTIQTSIAYQEQKDRSERATAFFTNNTLGMQNRSFTYSLAADYAATEYLKFNAGATRGESTSSSKTQTLSTLPPSVTSTIEDVVYASASFRYLFTRNLQYHGTVREDYRKTRIAETRGEQVDMYIDYRIRKVLVSIISRWRNDVPGIGPRITQQYYYVKASRPF